MATSTGKCDQTRKNGKGRDKWDQTWKNGKSTEKWNQIRQKGKLRYMLQHSLGIMQKKTHNTACTSQQFKMNNGALTATHRRKNSNFCHSPILTNTVARGECLPGALLFYSLSRLQPQIYPLMEKPPKVDHVALHTFPTKHVA